jgi:spermidine/putrescine transport system ATP-binding protein
VAQIEGEVGDLRLDHVSKDFGAFRAVDDLTLTIPQGSFFALLGPSGCGKTTTLRMVAGLEEPTAGRIFIGAKDITLTKPYTRPVNTVFQNYALFPHLDIFENVAFGLRRRGIKDVKGEVESALALVELGHLADRKPAQLSGGQQQRIALARAIVNRPSVLLLDEPLGALDLKLRRQMQLELKRIQTEVGITFVHVTHDQEEAMTMADTIAVMNGGRVEQMGAPTDLYENPRTTFVANFLGQSNLLAGEVGHRGTELSVDVHGNTFMLPSRRAATDASRVWVGVRPEKINLSSDRPANRNCLDATIRDISYVGVSTQFVVETGWGQQIMVFEQNDGSSPLRNVGEQVCLSWLPEHTFALDAAEDAKAGAELEDVY